MRRGSPEWRARLLFLPSRVLFHFEVYHMQICLIIAFTLSDPRICLLEAQRSHYFFFFFMLCSMKITPVYSSIQSLNALVPLCFCPALQVTPCWNTTGWSSPPKTGTTTTRRTTAPPSTTAPGGTATATRPTSTASTCAGSTPPTRTALSGPPGPAGSIRSSFPRWRFGPPAIWKTNELFFCSC